MSDPAIRVHDLVKLYARRGQPTVRAVDGLTFDVARGSIFGLLGPNGAGKTTLLKVLSTLARPTAGSASVLGHDVVAAPLNVRRRISVVIQETAVELFLTVRDNLGTFARFHGVRDAEIRTRAERKIARAYLDRVESGMPLNDRQRALLNDFRERLPSPAGARAAVRKPRQAVRRRAVAGDPRRSPVERPRLD
jgi:ABC-type multidrug transport system ATPase subunit